MTDCNNITSCDKVLRHAIENKISYFVSTICSGRSPIEVTDHK